MARSRWLIGTENSFPISSFPLLTTPSIPRPQILHGHCSDVFIFATVNWGPFLERPGNLTGPKSYFEIKVLRKVGRVLTSNEVNFVSLADTFTVQFSNLLKLQSGMENKTA